MNEVYEAIHQLLQQGGSGVVATVIKVHGSSPQIVGAKMLIRIDGSAAGTVGGGMMEARTVEKALEVLRTGRPEIVKIDLKGKDEGDPICGGEAEIFIEPVSVMPRVVIFGAGHVGLRVAEAAAMCGFRVLVADDREEWANPQKLPPHTEIFVKPFEEIFDYFKFQSTDYVVIVTRGHQYDELCLKNTITEKLAYLGMIGSKSKIASIYKNLQKQGFDKKLFKHVHSPIGIEIAAISPAEIAISIMAEIIKLYRGSRGDKSQCPA